MLVYNDIDLFLNNNNYILYSTTTLILLYIIYKVYNWLRFTELISVLYKINLSIKISKNIILYYSHRLMIG